MKQPRLQRSSLIPHRFRNLETATVGLIFGIIATAGYTLAGIILRDLADDTDPYWVSCIKAIPTLVVALWLIRQRRRRGERIDFPFRLLPILLAIGVIVQVGGNAGLQWAFEVIGLAISIPLMFGTLIVGSAAIGVLMFQERMTRRRIAAVVLLMAAVSVLSFAARSEDAQATQLSAASTSLAAIGVLVACLSGFAYATSHAAIRHYTSPTIPLSVPLAIFSVAGIIVLGAMSYWRLGWEGIAGTTSDQWSRLWAAGLVNAAAYFALGRAIQMLPLVQVNIITASQVALNAVAGIMIFSEPISTALVIGVVLTMIGLVIQGRRRKPVAVTETAAPDADDANPL